MQIARIIIFLTFSLSAQRTPRNVFMWIHPQCYLPVFNQGKRFGNLDFGRYREFLVSFGVVADLKCRVGCWRNFRLTIFQKVLLQLKNSFKTRYVSDTNSSRTCFFWCLLGPANTRPWCHEPFSQNSLKIPTVPFGIVACTFALFSDNLSRKSCISHTQPTIPRFAPTKG